MAKIRILIIEDDPVITADLSAIINKQRDVIVAAVSNGRDNTLVRTRGANPHVVLMDMGLESKNSLEVVQAVKKRFSRIKIIGMCLAPSQSDILEFVQAGAEGFILKDAKPEEVIRTIRAVAGGEKVLPYTMAGSLFRQVTANAFPKGRRNLKSAVRMTKREKEIIALIADGLSNKEIAVSLNIATFTVKSHVHNILEKLTLNNRLEIAKLARD